MRQLQLSKSTRRAAPFREIEMELFPRGLPCRVTRPIPALDRGRAAFNGTSWYARLYEPNCSTTLLPDQPALAIGRQGNTLIVMPLHCLLWTAYLEEHGHWLEATDIALMERCERDWRHS